MEVHISKKCFSNIFHCINEMKAVLLWNNCRLFKKNKLDFGYNVQAQNSRIRFYRISRGKRESNFLNGKNISSQQNGQRKTPIFLLNLIPITSCSQGTVKKSSQPIHSFPIQVNGMHIIRLKILI